MKINCKTGGSCPHGLDICCGICDSKNNCPCACDADDPQNCPDGEIITDELMAFQSVVPDTIQKITNLIQFKKELDEQEKQLKQKLVEAMEAHGIKSFENDLIKLTYVAPTTRSSIDSARLKKDHPDIAQQYTKVSDVAASVRVTLK